MSSTRPNLQTRNRAVSVALRLAACLCALAAPAAAAERRIKSLDLVLSRQPDLPVVRGLWQSRPGSAYDAEALAGDLYRLGLVGYTLARFEARTEQDGLALAITASHADRTAAPELASVELAGGIPEIDEAVRPLLSQRPSTLFAKSRLEYLGLLLDVERLEYEYAARGHLDAAVSRILIIIGGDESAAVRLDVVPGPRFRVGKLAVNGNRSINAEDLLKELKPAGDVMWSEALRADLLRRAARFCAERGFLDARLNVVPEKQPDGSVNVRIELTEGERFILENVIVRGADEHTDAVSRLVSLRKGQPISGAEVETIRRAIEDLGVFSEISVRFAPLRDKPPGSRDLVVELTTVRSDHPPTDAENLLVDMLRNIIALYNRGDAGVRSLRVSGFFTADSPASAGATTPEPAEGRRVQLDGAVIRPDYARVKLVIPPDPAVKSGRPTEVIFLRDGRDAALRLSPLGPAMSLPSLSLALNVAILPPDVRAGLPAEFALAPGITGGADPPDVLVIGERCQQSAAHFTRYAKSFARKTPRLEPDGSIIVPDDSAGGGSTRILPGPDKLPRRITRLDARGRLTAQFDFELNPKLERDKPPELAGKLDNATGLALAAPILWSLGLSAAAMRTADQAVAADPKNAAALAARGLIRVAAGSADAGLADLRSAADGHAHPACRLLLAETLIRARRFTEAKAVCRSLLDVQPDPDRALDPADLVLGASLSLTAAVDVLFAGPGDYRHRATVDCALAHVGLREYEDAAALARKLLESRPDDPHASEVLARCELSLGRPKAALDAVGRVKPAGRKPELDLYAALAHHTLNEDDKAARALADAFAKAPAFRNLLFLHERAIEIDPRLKDSRAKAALAKLLSRATLASLQPDEKAKLAAIVNDARIAKSDVDRLAAALASAAPEPKDPARLRTDALNRLIDDALITRWAAWRGIVVREDEILRAMQAEMKQAGIDRLDDYARQLEQRGTNLLARRAEIRDHLLKRQAIAIILADKVAVRPPEVLAAYEQNPQQFKVPPAARIRMLTLHFVRFREKDEAVRLADALLRRIREKPDSFEALAKEYSHDANADKGGLWDGVTKGSFLGQLDDAVFKLKPGELSGVIQTDRACHIVRAEAFTPERSVPLEEAAPQIVRALQEAQARVAAAAWLAQLRAESCVELLDNPPAP